MSSVAPLSTVMAELPPKALAELGEIVLRHAGGRPLEWTVELAPSSVTAQRLAALRQLGVTRVSLGVQTFRPALLEVARKRGATPAQVALAWLLARSPVMLPIPGTSSVAHLEENWVSHRIALELSDRELIARGVP